MTMSFAAAGSDDKKQEKSSRCYLVSLTFIDGTRGYFKARYIDAWDDVDICHRYDYTRAEAFVYYRNCNKLTYEMAEKIATAHMCIYSGDWHYDLDEGIAAINITAQQMEDIFVDRWKHRDLS
jgi:hypothetical protein